MTVRGASQNRGNFRNPPDRQYFLGAPFDSISENQVVKMIDEAVAGDGFRYIVTPNADHVVRLNRDWALKPYYDDAWLTLCDSRPIAMFAKSRSVEMPHITGSDLTIRLFRSVIKPGDRITLIVGTQAIADEVMAAYPEVNFRAMVPPAGVWTNPIAQKACVDFASSAEARFVFIAIGSPQSEKIAYQLSRHPNASGIGLCVGGALEFLVGTKQRAPLWMRRSGFEWLHRMASDPKRLWRRYVYSAVPLLRLFSLEMSVKREKPG